MGDISFQGRQHTAIRGFELIHIVTGPIEDYHSVLEKVEPSQLGRREGGIGVTVIGDVVSQKTVIIRIMCLEDGELVRFRLAFSKAVPHNVIELGIIVRLIRL